MTLKRGTLAAGEALYRVEHETRYRHTGRASTSQHIACLTPRTLPTQQVESHTLTVDPAPGHRSQRHDSFGNLLDHFTILTPYLDLRVVARSVVRVSARGDSPVDPELSPPWELVRDALVYQRGALPSPAAAFRFASPYVALDPAVAAFARESFEDGRPFLSSAIDLMHRVHRDFRFDTTATSVTTPISRVLAERRGVCQDFAHFQIGCLRALGLPARYISGYLLTDPPPGQPRLVGADASHAWLSVHCPVHGWVDLDPTNDVLPDLRHIVTAWGRDYGDVSPLRGVVLGGQAHTLHVGVSVTPQNAEC